MQLGEEASKGAKWTALASGLNGLIGVAQISIVARFLEPSDFGIVAMILVALAIANVFVTVGFSDVLVVKHEATPEQLSTMYWLNVLVGIVAYAVLFVSAPLLSLVIDRDGVETLVRVMGLTLLLGALVVQFNALMRRELRLKAVAIIGCAAHVAGFIIAVGFAAAGFGVWSLIVAALATQLVTNAGLLYYAARYRWFPQRVFKLSGVAEMIRFGGFRIGAALVNTVNSKVDQLAIGTFLGAGALGVYTVAYNLAMQPFTRINPVLTQVSFPVFAKVKDDDAKLLRGYRRGVRVLTAINAPLLIGLIAVAPILIPAFLGPGWEESIPVLQILCVFVLLRSVSNINIGLILAKGKYRWPLYWNLFLLMIIPVTVFVAARISQSLIVVSWAVVGVQIFLFLMAYVLFARRLLGGFAFGYLNDFGRPVVTAGLMAVSVTWLQLELALQSNWQGLVIMVPAGAVLYVALSFVLQRQHAAELITLAKAKM